MDDKQSEIPKRFLTGWDARIHSDEGDHERSQMRERHLGLGVALGTTLGVAVGVGLGIAFGDLALGICFGVAIGTGIGVALGAALGDKHAKAVRAEASHRDSDDGS